LLATSPQTPSTAPKPAPATAPPATIFQGGKFVLNDGKGTVTEALLESGGRIVAVGRLADLEKRPDAAGAARVDLGGAYAVPGLQDAHGHLVSYGSSLVEVDLRGLASFEEVIDRVAERASKEK